MGCIGMDYNGPAVKTTLKNFKCVYACDYAAKQLA